MDDVGGVDPDGRDECPTALTLRLLGSKHKQDKHKQKQKNAHNQAPDSAPVGNATASTASNAVNASNASTAANASSEDAVEDVLEATFGRHAAAARLALAGCTVRLNQYAGLVSTALEAALRSFAEESHTSSAFGDAGRPKVD